MDMYINWNNDQNSMLIPINPNAFQKAGSQNNTSVYIHDFGEINLKGKRGLYTLSLESFFPAQQYHFQHGPFYHPYDFYCKNLTSLYENNETVHLIITNTDINMYCTIESFSHGEEERNGDVKYSLSFKECRPTVSTERVTTKTRQSSYIWKKGDTWPKVCKKILGTSNNWKVIRKQNATVISKAKKIYKKKYPKAKSVSETVALIGSRVVIK